MEQLADIAAASGNIFDALTATEKAADYYEADSHSKSSFNNCLVKAGSLAAQSGEYTKAISCFERAAQFFAPTLPFKSKSLVVDACFCHLGNDDLVSVKKSLQKYSELLTDFPNSREFTFLDALSEAITNHDSDKFASTITDYDYVHRLQRWQVVILSKYQQNEFVDSIEDFS